MRVKQIYFDVTSQRFSKTIDDFWYNIFPQMFYQNLIRLIKKSNHIKWLQNRISKLIADIQFKKGNNIITYYDYFNNS